MINLSKKLLSIVGRTNARYKMVQGGDKILLGLSGGKDSLALAFVLKHMQNVTPEKFEFKAVTLSYGMGEDYAYLTKFCNEHGIEHEVIDSSIFEISKDKIRKNSSFCSFFSRMRRGYLYTYALNNGYNKLAIAHHLDDAAESFFMNFTYNGALRTLAPKYTAKNGIEVIRPFIFVRERALRENAVRNELFVIGDEACPAMRFDVKMPHARHETKQLLAQLESQNPKLFTSLRAAFENIHLDTFFAVKDDE
ncbi:tRNA-cytidine(32) 2-sulfurtransferase [Campylobacter majalis]|uniref:tRNA-cytidine(32) 2-sulfurtransferase n=1 Tax=Campylobacter majalis TaxID=2790656 RepID=A0ABN7K4Y5_9BACT|nr:tRNA 2-thiocytidine biosynthesis TtcA family protein [Campylobacter majalis]CAD7287583.1 tRNA-cytidine(32) 2-sulfurtransferase [Campylobacter majalis]